MNGSLVKSMSEMRVALVDDHQMVRDGLAAMIESFPSYEVAMQASNGKEFVQMLEHLKLPDMVIIDIHMPIMNGFETIAHLAASHPDLPCLALTFDDSESIEYEQILGRTVGLLYWRRALGAEFSHQSLRHDTQ